MMGLGVLLLIAVVVAGVVGGAVWADNRALRTSLRTWRLSLPSGLSAEQVASWLATVTAGGGARQQLLRAATTHGLEIVATKSGIEFYLLVQENATETVLSSLRAALPGVRVDAAPKHLTHAARPVVATQLRLTSPFQPLATERAEATVAAFLAGLQPLHGKERIQMSWLFTGRTTPLPSLRTTQNPRPASILGAGQAADRNTVQAERVKYRYPLLAVTGRISVEAASVGRARRLLGQVTGTLAVMNASGVQVVRHLLPTAVVAWAMKYRLVSPWPAPMLLNTMEAVGLLGLPIGELHLPGVGIGAARQLPVPAGMARFGTRLGVSNYAGSVGRPVVIARPDRLRHLWVGGPSGRGKSVLLTHIAQSDIAHGDAVVVVDMKGDLVPDVLARVAEADRKRLIVIDPTAAADGAVTGYNPLAGANTYLAVDQIVHAMRELWRDSWGPRTQDVLRAGLLTLAFAKAPDGSRFTVIDLPTLLTNPALRRFVTRQKRVPAGLTEFWATYESYSDAQRTEVIAPVLNKLRGLTLSPAARMMLGQSRGIDLTAALAKRQVVLVRLSRGELGTETARLLASLLFSSVWQAVLGRAGIDPAKRRPASIILDEFADIVRLPGDLTDTLAQARGLGAGLVLAHQYLGQVPETVKAAILGTVGTHVTFQTGYDDAQILSRSFAPLTRQDLMGLGRWEIAVCPSIDGHTAPPTTATTLPLGPALTDGATLARASQQRFGMPVAEIEQAITARTTVPESSRSRRVGRSDREEAE